MLYLRFGSKLLKHIKDLTSFTMSVFTQKINPVTGKYEWELHPEDYDYHQEIASSAYADMLHDTERNVKYQVALEIAIKKFHDRGEKAHVLDIGTGTGLLSMMAAQAGADTIVACEAFQPMSKCALEVIQENGYIDAIRVVPKRSTDLKVGPGLDLEHKANILVTEVFDTELIGEGAIGTFNHAHEFLLEKDCIVVPSSGTMYAQVVESEWVSRWNRVQAGKNDKGETLLEPPPVFSNCAGSAAVHDLQLSQISPTKFTSISSPLSVFRFDWSGKNPLPEDEVSVERFKAEKDGVAQMVFMWWDLVMDTDGEVLLSCAPYWAHPDKPEKPDEIPWRDHWMQAVYYFPEETPVQRGREYELVSSHDEYSLGFSVTLPGSSSEMEAQRPICTCNLHVSLCRTRLGQMNCSQRWERYSRALGKLVKAETVCLCLGDFSLLGLVAAKLGAKKVICIEETKRGCDFLEQYAVHNGLNHIVDIVHVEDFRGNLLNQKHSEVNLVIGEPHYSTSILPWQNIRFWYQIEEFSTILAKNCVIMPHSAVVRAIAVEFADLWKISAPLHSVEGFKMRPFDKLIKDSRGRGTASVNPEPLWEYPGRSLSPVFDVLRLIPGKEGQLVSSEMKGVVPLREGKCHGVVLWIDWNLDASSEDYVTSGPIENQLGDWIKWDVYTRQGVFFMPENGSGSLLYSAKFNPGNGGMDFHFEFER